ncbi:MAG: peptidoglycan DD-metalloendopeptidase family protein [Magnetococcales bacterium]|nr:peptidoglycan DD-metalloendopeptidase family protein [Magnetococcales bacterium]NGZ27126.1 peptidoglycan DD-metalloendopeptidase family protein [Magnetococcales bacterium]
MNRAPLLWLAGLSLISLPLLTACYKAPSQPAKVRVEVGPPLAWGAGDAKPIRRSKSGYYQVKEADTLWAIAMVHDVDMEDLAKWNNIRDPDVIVVGQQLRLGPGEGAPVEPGGREGGAVAAGPVLAPIGGESSSLGESTPLPAPIPAPVSSATSTPAPTAQPLPMETASLAMAEPHARPLAKPDASEKEKPASEESGKSGDVAKSVDYNSILKAPAPKGWRWPLQGKILQKFGQFGQQRFNGIDIAAKEGASVEAAAPGIVAYADDGLSSYGNLILIRHGGSYMSAYAHNATILVKPGQKVSAGQVIAKAGHTGSASTAKLHFELRRGIQPVDPLQYLPKAN